MNNLQSKIFNKLSENHRILIKKIINGKRINADECLLLYEEFDLPLLGMLANTIKHKKFGNKVFYNKNIHVEPTNICKYKCRFCSYHKNPGDKESWNYTTEEILDLIKEKYNPSITEVHIVGGVHPDFDFDYYKDLISAVNKNFPGLHIKAFTAVEYDNMFKKSSINPEEGFKILMQAGLQSIPGGGAEIFDENIRLKICPNKADSKRWLELHEIAHKCGLKSNATMLYGHIENYKHRIDHMLRIRTLQDKTKGFNAFIPLKFKSKNNNLQNIGEVNILEDLKVYAISRIFLDNIEHIKVYWPMTGKEFAQLSLSFGVDDIDGTIDNSTKIYSMAGSKEINPVMTVDEIKSLASSAGFEAVERDSLYNELN